MADNNGPCVDVYVQRHVYDHVVDHICNGSFTPGSKISDREIAKVLGVSHMSVREAFGSLEENGWIRRVPQRGAYIRELTLKEVEEAFILREVVEATAVRILIGTLTAEQLSELDATVAMLEAASDRGDRNGYLQADEHFHAQMIEYTGSDRLSQLFDTVMRQHRCSAAVLRTIAISWNLHLYGAGHEHSRIAGHRRILDAIHEGEGDLAEHLIRLHIRKSWRLVKEHGATGLSGSDPAE